MLPHLQKRRALCYISSHALKKRRNNKEAKGVQKMENHLTDAFVFIKLTLLSVLFFEFLLWLLLWICKNISHIPLIYIYRYQQKRVYHRAAFPKGIAALFLLGFFTLISTYCFFVHFICIFRFHQAGHKTCFSPGCRSPPSVFDF